MSDYPKVNNEVHSTSSVDSLNTNSCSSKNSASTNENVNSIKYQESTSGLSTPPTASTDTCDSGFTEFFSNKAGTSTQSRILLKNSDSNPPKTKRDSRDAYTTSDSDSDSKWKTDEVMQCLDDDSYDGSESDETDFRSKEKVGLSRINYRWIEWCHKQLVNGVNPRTILRKIFHNGEFPVPPGTSDRELWERIACFVTQPPARKRLHDINSVDHVIRLLTTCKNIIVLTGAGVSVSCGIPDFRSRSGIYSRLRSEIPEINDPHEIFDIRFFSKDPRPFFKFAKELYPGSFTPSLCHRFIRLLERKEKLLRNYSQNIDTLERSAGIEKVVECHGSFATASCTKCGIVVTADEIRDDVLAKRIPMCAICNPVNGSSASSSENQSKRISHSSSMTDGYKDLYEMGILKPDIVFFGESLPEVFHPAVNADRQQCDCLLVIGSSLKVRPVSLIPEFLKENVPQILINRERVGNYVFDVELLGDADIIVNQICRMIGGDWTEICEQPELRESSTLEFNPETTETVSRPIPASKIEKSSENDSTQPDIVETTPMQCESTLKTTENAPEVQVLPTESNKAVDHPTTCEKEKPTCSGDVKPEDKKQRVEEARQKPEGTDNNTSKTVFVFSIDNVPSGCYYLTPPNKYVFPGSTHTWYGTGDPDKDREEILEVEVEDDDDFVIDFGDDDDDDDDDDDVEEESSTNHGENSDSDDIAEVAQKSSDTIVFDRKRALPVGIEMESVSPVKQQKMNDE